MASPRRCSPTAPDRECKLPPPSAPAGEYPPGKLSWGTLARALGRFTLSIPHTRLLATLDPLALDREPPPQLSPEKQQMPEKLIWGDQEPLSKVRTAAGDSGLFPTREEGARAVEGTHGKPTWLHQGLQRVPRPIPPSVVHQREKVRLPSRACWRCWRGLPALPPAGEPGRTLGWEEALRLHVHPDPT